ncbi:MAG: hypothetical protein HY868_09795 [Chloroflexi bacterium]|nr:hypothetical protein [Chloroflexota bacterium]
MSESWDADGRGWTRIEKIYRPRLSAFVRVQILFALLFLAACQSSATPAPTPTPPLAIQAGIAGIVFDERAVLLDQRAEPFFKVMLVDDAEIIGGDNQPISLLDLRSGDVVRLEGHATAPDTFRAQRVVVIRALAALPTRAPTSIYTSTPSATPRASATPTITPPIPAGDRLPLPGTLFIADSGNNRVIEVTNERRVVWTSADNAPDDVMLTPTGKSLIVNHARFSQIAEIDLASRAVTWSFGAWGIAAPDDTHLNTPTSAHRVSDGLTLVADTRNCRIVAISPEKRIVAQMGKTGQCGSDPGLLDQPVGVSPLPNGRVLVTEAGNRRVSEMDSQGKVYRTITLPNVAYPSEAHLTRAGNVLIAAYEKPGRVFEIAWNGKVMWEFFPRAESEWLDRPSHPLELPNGNIAFSDDLNHRVVIINRAGRVLWQYGVRGVAGTALGYLNTPRGLDFRAMPIPAATFTALVPTGTPATR